MGQSMATRATCKPSTVTWWPPAKARDRLAEVYGPRFAGRKLVELVVHKRVRWRAAEYRFRRPWIVDEQGLAAFKALVADPAARIFSPKRIIDIDIDYEEDTVSRHHEPVIGLGFQVVAEDIEAELRKALPGPKHKPGPGAERKYDRPAIITLAKAVLKRFGRPKRKQMFFNQVRDEAPEGLILPQQDYPTLNTIIGRLWDKEH
jgi:hypothetical protein